MKILLLSLARDPKTLSNFPIAEIVNGQALEKNKSIRWREG